MSRLELWSCAHGGIEDPEAEALELDRYHNWGSFMRGDVPLISLKPGPRYPSWPYGDRLMIANEPNNQQQDGYCGRGWEAGQRAAQLARMVPQGVSNAIAGNFFCGDLNKVTVNGDATCYTGNKDTRSAGRTYWQKFKDGWQWDLDDDDDANPLMWGLHWYERATPPAFDWPRCCQVLSEFVEWASPVPVAITEFGVEEWGWDYARGAAFMEKAVTWCAENDVAVFAWCQWPSRWAKAGLWRSNALTPLGRHYRDLGRMIRAGEPPEPDEPHLETVELMSDSSWIIDGYQYDVRVTRRRL